jgi:sulfopyruvate decarboxylase subunit beta
VNFYRQVVKQTKQRWRATSEWYHLNPSDGNFRSRTLGLASGIGLGIALGLPNRKVIVLDGDGSALVNLCGLPTAAGQRRKI